MSDIEERAKKNFAKFRNKYPGKSWEESDSLTRECWINAVIEVTKLTRKGL